MKFSLLLVALATASGIQAAATHSNNNNTSDCIQGSLGFGKGNGFNGYCCLTDDDCLQDCQKGICNGLKRPPPFSTTSYSTTFQKGLLPYHGKCHEGAYGLKKKNGYRGYCCKSNKDCVKQCKKGVCKGPKQPSFSTTSYTTSFFVTGIKPRMSQSPMTHSAKPTLY